MSDFLHWMIRKKIKNLPFPQEKTSNKVKGS